MQHAFYKVLNVARNRRQRYPEELC